MSDPTATGPDDVVHAIERIESDTIEIADGIKKLVTTSPQRHARIRVGFKPTASRGWEYDSTAEVEFDPSQPGAQDAATAVLHQLTVLGRDLGEVERHVRNRRDRGEGDPAGAGTRPA